MVTPEDRILVAVSGGKDSLALWDVLLDRGHDADGLYLGLGIGEYSDRSHEATWPSRDARGATLVTVDLERGHGFDVPTAGRKGRAPRARSAGCRSGTCSTRPPCDGGYDVIATGHNLDDEAATLLGQHPAVEHRVHRPAVAGAARTRPGW